MIHMIITNEREFNTKVNEMLATLPNAKINLSPVPFMTPKGIKICAYIEYGDDINSGAEDDSNDGNDGSDGNGGNDDNDGSDDNDD